MNGFLAIFVLMLRSLLRSKAALMLLLASETWMVALPFVLRSDGTAEGARELYLRYSLGGSFLIVLVVTLAMAAGSLAKERDAFTLQLSLVRPVQHWVLALAKICAITFVGATVIILAGFTTFFFNDPLEMCYSVKNPVLPSIESESEKMYNDLVKDPKIEKELKGANRVQLLEFLSGKISDSYDVIEADQTNRTVAIKFDMNGEKADRVRVKFSTSFNLRDDVALSFKLGTRGAIVTNSTQSVFDVPLGEISAKGDENSLVIENLGSQALMYRIRKDIQVLVKGDAFVFNVLRASMVLISIIALAVAFGVFLSSALSHPVAVFTAMTVMVVITMTPPTNESYFELKTLPLGERMSIAVAETIADATRSVVKLHPIEDLATGIKIEPVEVLGAVGRHCFLEPLLLALLSGLIMLRKVEGV